jgi:hypothetical protein
MEDVTNLRGSPGRVSAQYLGSQPHLCVTLVASGCSRPGLLQSRAGAREEGDGVADDGFLLEVSGSGMCAWIW